ncbi:hypothetical protein KW791_03970 [Candidatus Parcubacteria bacterium]|nr:hypothetical protein [Candidatus Parcubacteria bacterium]
MEDDFNTPAAISTFFSLINSSNAAIQNKKLDVKEAKKLKEWLITKSEVFGIIPESIKIPKEVEELAVQREAARNKEDWDAEKNYKTQIAGLGYEVSDTPYGSLIKKK